MNNPATFIWFTFSSAIFLGILIFAAGVLVGLCVGLRGNSPEIHSARHPSGRSLASAR
jgi:hypothetical protein